MTLPDASGRDRQERPRRSSVTLADVAERAGVSKATASRVFAAPGTAAAVNATTRRRVLRVARELGWRPHRAARTLARKRSGLIGAIVPGFAGGFIGAVMDGVAEAAEGAGYEVMFMRYRQGEEDIGRELDSLLEMRVEGILFYPSSSLLIQDDRVADGLQGVPCVLLDQTVDGLTLPLVAGDSVSGMRQVADHLVSLGHTRIGYLAGPSSARGAEIRLSAFRDRLEEHGLRLSDKLVARYDWNMGWGRAVSAAQRLLRAEPVPSAIAAANDVGAGAVMQVARDAGLRVPGDLAVVGYGDTVLSHTWTPPLTTVKQPVAKLGETACSELVCLMRNGGAGDRTSVRLLPVALVVRGSCGGTMLPIGSGLGAGERQALSDERSRRETAGRGAGLPAGRSRGAKEVRPQTGT